LKLFDFHTFSKLAREMQIIFAVFAIFAIFVVVYIVPFSLYSLEP